jgi:hypothetical protein
MTAKNLVAYLPRRDAQVERMFQKKGFVFTFDENSRYDIAVFTGGSDVSPFLYGQKCLQRTMTDPARDLFETGVFKRMHQGVPKVGICRGGQFLNVMSGGTMWQHVDRHGRDHQLMDFITGELINVSSTHHQMMVPAENADIIAMASESTLKEDDTGKYTVSERGPDKEDMKDHEVLYYENYNALCFQPHPEYEGYKDCHAYFWLLVDTLLFNQKGQEIQVG